METITAGVEKEQGERERFGEIPVVKAVRKYIYMLPSGRRLKVIVDDERELAAELSMLRPYLVA